MFSDLQFDDRRHLYYVNNINYPSVSSLIKLFERHVDFDAILPYSAAKAGLPPDELKEQWIKKRDDACYLGHVTHNFMECFNGIQTPRTPQEVAGVKFFRDYIGEYEIVYRELRGYSRQLKFAGTMDLPLIGRNDGKIIIADYKTNGDLFKNYKSTTLLPPFDTMEATPYNKYQIQLSLYQIIFEELGFTVDDRWLVHLKPDESYRVFKLFNLTNELKDYFLTKQTKVYEAW